MSCESYDWKAYALGELDARSRQEAEAHAAACPQCREELASLRLTLDTLSTLREEEIPRRIAFVSDQIFEPRWYQRLLQSLWTPNFAAACVVAAAILVHAFHVSASDPAAVAAQIDTAVNKAVAAEESRHTEQVEAIVNQFGVQEREMYTRTVGLVRQ